jgi:SAM-dependent methyltransferase
MSKYKDELIRILSEINIRGDKVLSIGNLNDDRKYFKSANIKDWQTLDIHSNLRPNYVFDVNKPIFDDEIEFELADQLVEKFDYVFAFELWDYIWDPMAAHKNIFTFLKPGGTYMGSYPMVYPKHNPEAQDMLRYTDEAIKKYLMMMGFSAYQIIPRFGNELLKQFYSEDGMRMAKGFDHSITGWVVKAKK